MKQEYKFTKTIAKGAVSALTSLIVLATFAGFNDVGVWDLITQYIKPVVGSLTVGGALVMAINFVKFNYLS